MNLQQHKYLIVNYIFVFCVITLFLNDHFLKREFSNWLTGKLSDVTGIIILPLILAYTFPKLKRQSIWISAVGFLFWKSGYSQGLINFYNQYAPIAITRVVDYSDMIVLAVLPLPYLIIEKAHQWNALRIKRLPAVIILVPTVLILMATSPPKRFYYTQSNGNLHCMKCSFTVEYSQTEILEKLSQHGIVFDSITPLSDRIKKRYPDLEKEDLRFYKLNQLVIDMDTLRNIDFSMLSQKNGNTKIYFNGMQVKENVSTTKLMIKARKHYKKIIFKELHDAMNTGIK